LLKLLNNNNSNNNKINYLLIKILYNIMTQQQQSNIPIKNNLNSNQQQNQEFVKIKSTSSFPEMSSGTAILILILNILFPGLGTMIMGCMSDSPGSWICIGLLQFFLCFIIIGWIWSIVTGVMCVQNTKKSKFSVGSDPNAIIMA
jgi:hypothetical protein